eukprot:CAMPEP_0180195958 /NCGR_PEP_ID=MMETSP0987-20121128/3863_1 /TAXON_ID=697907 /ORGANISM="non described non described, Strain CCMP2293" /LENGTH=306 /DNA_ID=CAMNT_0022150831 /DNA_START=713 /DNA_END=1631 /DNA_ORIENTATION=+
MEQGLQHAGRVGQGSGKERGDFVLVRTSTGPQMFPPPVVIGDHILRRVVAGSVQRNKNRRVPLPRRRASPSHSRVSGPWEPLSSFWLRRAGVGSGARGAGWQGAVGKRELEPCSELVVRAGGTEAEREKGGPVLHCDVLLLNAQGSDGWTQARAHAGQQSMHARSAAERARSRTRTWSREGMRPGAIPACTEAVIENLTALCRRERRLTREQRSMHAGHESMHTEERAQGAGMGCSLARGWAERASGLRTRPNPESSCLSASAPRTAAPSAGEERLGDAVLARSWARRTPHRTPNEVRSSHRVSKA